MVESLVMNAGKRFHDARLNPDIRFGFHALAIDEKRRDFPPYPWDETRVSEGQTIEQVWFAGVHESYSGFWKFRGSRTRSIPGGALVHRSVIERMKNPANRYKPKNLPETYAVVEW